MEYKFYINKNTFINDKQGLKPGVSIEKIPAIYTIDFTEGEGPFNDLPTLRKKSTIFRNLLLRNPKRAQQVCLDKNISVVKDFIFTKEDFSVNKDFINIFEHCVRGEVKKGKVSGVHYFDKERVRIIKIVNQNKSNGIIEAEIEYCDKKTNEWIKRDKPTTLFPLNWSIHQLFHECVYAMNNKEKKTDSNNVYTSTTESGIKVKIISINNKMKSIYPLLE